MYHHTAGIYLCQRIFGDTLRIGRKQIPVRLIAERHVLEDLGWLPSPAGWIARPGKAQLVLRLNLSGRR
ncbi:DUF6915 family protein [Micromonospora polyrhachis]|uniref:DUF6915 family protein n=1 Tax=Micromonospora polyrhachis TaxID=1282883 RepID=UPI0035E3FD98